MWVLEFPGGDLEQLPLPIECITPREVWIEGSDWWLGCHEGVFTTGDWREVFAWPQLDVECPVALPEPKHPMKTLQGKRTISNGCADQVPFPEVAQPGQSDHFGF